MQSNPRDVSSTSETTTKIPRYSDELFEATLQKHLDRIRHKRILLCTKQEKVDEPLSDPPSTPNIRPTLIQPDIKHQCPMCELYHVRENIIVNLTHTSTNRTINPISQDLCELAKVTQEPEEEHLQIDLTSEPEFETIDSEEEQPEETIITPTPEPILMSSFLPRKLITAPWGNHPWDRPISFTNQLNENIFRK